MVNHLLDILHNQTWFAGKFPFYFDVFPCSMPIYFRDFPFKVPFFIGKTHQSTHRKSSKMGTYLHQLQRSPELPGAWERHWRHHQWPRSPGRAKYPSSNEMMAVACCGHGHSMKFSVLNFSQCLVSDDLMLDIF